MLTLSLIRQFCSRRLWTYFVKNIENLHNWMDNLWQKMEKTLWQKEKLHVLCNFFFCHYVFKKAVCCRGVGKRLYEGMGQRSHYFIIAMFVNILFYNNHIFNIFHEFTMCYSNVLCFYITLFYMLCCVVYLCHVCIFSLSVFQRNKVGLLW